jgi:hypothetical protein
MLRAWPEGAWSEKQRREPNTPIAEEQGKQLVEQKESDRETVGGGAAVTVQIQHLSPQGTGAGESPLLKC